MNLHFGFVLFFFVDRLLPMALPNSICSCGGEKYSVSIGRSITVINMKGECSAHTKICPLTYACLLLENYMYVFYMLKMALVLFTFFFFFKSTYSQFVYFCWLILN